MSSPATLPCRVVAEREGTSPWWSFYLVNDGGTTIESVELTAVRYEFGDQYLGGTSPGTRIDRLEPGARGLLWRDDGGSEMRTDLWLRVARQDQEIWMLFEFPRLYKQTETTLVAGPITVNGPPRDLA